MALTADQGSMATTSAIPLRSACTIEVNGSRGCCRTIFWMPKRPLRSSIFINTSARVAYFNIKDSLNAYADRIAAIDTFYRGALYACSTAKVTLPYAGIFSICENILMNWNDLLGDYQHSTYSKFRTISNQRQCAVNELELLTRRYGAPVDFTVSPGETPRLTEKTKAEVRETVETFASLVCPFLDDFDQFLSQHVFVS